MLTRKRPFSDVSFLRFFRASKIILQIFLAAGLLAAAFVNAAISRANDSPPGLPATPPSAQQRPVPKRAAAPETFLPVVMFTDWRDPKEGAFTISVPQGWQVTGGAFRRSDIDITHSIHAGTADSRVSIFMNDPDITPREVPNDLTDALGQKEGQTMTAAWGGPILLSQFQQGQDFVQSYVQSKVCPSAQITRSGQLEKETAEMDQTVAPYAVRRPAQAQSSVGEVFYRCGDDYGYATATTLAVWPAVGRGVTLWFVYSVSGFTVKKEVDAAFAMYVLHTAVSSFKLDSQWEARSQQAAQALTDSVTQMQNAIAQNIRQQATARADVERPSVVHGNSGSLLSSWNAAAMPNNPSSPGNQASNSQANSQIASARPPQTRGSAETSSSSGGAASSGNSSATISAGATNKSTTTKAPSSAVAEASDDPVWAEGHSNAGKFNYYWTRADGSIIATATGATPTARGGGWHALSSH